MDTAPTKGSATQNWYCHDSQTRLGPDAIDGCSPNPQNMTSRKCRTCGLELPMQDYYRSGEKYWSLDCKNCARQKAAQYRATLTSPQPHSEQAVLGPLEGYAELQARRRKIYELKLVQRVIGHYSHGTNRCSQCGESKFELLTLDHDRNLRSLCYQLIREKFPPGHRVLCINCNTIACRVCSRKLPESSFPKRRESGLNAQTCADCLRRCRNCGKTVDSKEFYISPKG